MTDLYLCPKCQSQRVYWLMPAGTHLKCWDCEHTWAFRFILFIREWKVKVSA